MARSRLFKSVASRSGDAIANARVNVFLAGTSTPVSDLYTAASGGSAVAFLTSGATGHIDGWFDTPKAVRLVVTDNTNTAYYVGAAATLLDFADYEYDNVPVYENPGDGETDDTAFALVQTTVTNLTLSGTFAARPAAGTAGRVYHATDQGIPYRDTGTTWQRMIGGPNEIWWTDYGAVPSTATPSAAVMTANVAAWNTALTAARSTVLAPTTAPYKEAAIVIPGMLSGWKYYVNAPLNFEYIEVRGLNGSIHGNFGEKNTRVWVDGTAITSGLGTFELKNTGVFTAGVAASSAVTNLYVVGNTNAIRNEGRAFLIIRDCDLWSNDTAHADRAALYLENCFWIRVERGGMTCAGGGTGADERCILMVASNDGLGDVQGVSQAQFRNLVLGGGQIRFEHRRSAGVQGTDSANVEFHDVVSENVGTQAFFNYVRTTGATTIAHDLNLWTFGHCERADAVTVGASFLSMDFGTDSGAASVGTMKNVTIYGSNPYSQFLLRAIRRGSFKNVTIMGALIGTTLMSSDSTASVQGVKRFTENSFGVLTSIEEGYGALHVMAPYASTTPLWRVNSTGRMVTLASSTTEAGVNLPHGAAPTAPANGDMWTTTAGLFVRINGATVGPLT